MLIYRLSDTGDTGTNQNGEASQIHSSMCHLYKRNVNDVTKVIAKVEVVMYLATLFVTFALNQCLIATFNNTIYKSYTSRS